MLEDLILLVEVQAIDVRILEINKEREKLPVLVARAKEELSRAESEARAAQEAFDAATKEKKAAESEAKLESERLIKMKLRSSEIKTNKEYYAHLKEIEDCQKKITSLDDRSLELMEKIEKEEAELKDKKARLAEEEKKFEQEKAEIEKGFEDGVKELKELKKKRDALLPKASKPASDQYRHVLQRYPDSAVAEAVAGSCAGCRMMIPPQVFNNVRKGEAIISCNNCGRILYYKD